MKMLMIVSLTSKPSVSAVLFGFHGTNLLKNLVSREWLRILKNFHFSISISKHFDFTFHFSKKSEGILFSLCTSRKRKKAFLFTFHFSKKSESFLFSLFTSRTSKTHTRWSLIYVLSIIICLRKLKTFFPISSFFLSQFLQH